MNEITPGQILSLKSALKTVCDDARAYPDIVSFLLECEVAALKDLTEADWAHLRDEAYPNWQDGDWTAGPEFRAEARAIYESYLERNYGHSRMF